MSDVLEGLAKLVAAIDHDYWTADFAHDFIRTHHAEIAEVVKDAALWRYLVRENNKGGRGAFRIVWFDEDDDGFTTTDGVSVDGKDEQAIIRIVSDAMHNSAREGVMVICDYCGKAAELVTGREVYPHRPDLFAKRLYQCLPCNAVVGCHEGTETPLGRLANPELRKAKMEAHAFFDPIWKSKSKKRGSAYAWLADKLGIAKTECHIGMFDVVMCNRVVEVCRNANRRTPERTE